jgi:serine/threonine protein kinase
MKHPHIVQLCATYVWPLEFGMLTQPFSEEGSLRGLMDKYLDIRTKLAYTNNKTQLASMPKILENSFGCLANPLAFIHSKSIVVNDFRSRKILIHKGRVLISGFGSAVRFRDSTVTTMGGISERATEDEVLEPMYVNFDVLPLRCVFWEILYALTVTGVFEIPDHTIFWRRLHNSTMGAKYLPLEDIIHCMTCIPGQRSSAATVATLLKEVPGFPCGSCGPSSDIAEMTENPQAHIVSLQKVE